MNKFVCQEDNLDHLSLTIHDKGISVNLNLADEYEVYVTLTPEQAMEMADSLIKMAQGEIVNQAPADMYLIKEGRYFYCAIDKGITTKQNEAHQFTLKQIHDNDRLSRFLSRGRISLIKV